MEKKLLNNTILFNIFPTLEQIIIYFKVDECLKLYFNINLYYI